MVGVTAIEVSVVVIVMLRAFVAIWTGLLPSVTRTVKLKVPVAAGVPVIAPVFWLRFNPVGSAPEVRDQVYGPVPPIAARALE